MTDSFELQPPKPVRKVYRSDDSDKQRQNKLFSGVDCLPGQRELFNPDGYEDERDEAT